MWDEWEEEWDKMWDDMWDNASFLTISSVALGTAVAGMLTV